MDNLGINPPEKVFDSRKLVWPILLGPILIVSTIAWCQEASTPGEVQARNCQRNQVDCLTDTNTGCSGGCSKTQKDCVPSCKGCYINR